MSALSALRPGHWIGIGLVAALIATGAWTNIFGLLGGNASEAKRLNSCLHNHGVDVAALATSAGGPATLINGGKAVDQAIKQSASNGQIKHSQVSDVLGCLHRVAH